jgi:hypothetical protein
MAMLHTISFSEICRGDHLYTRYGIFNKMRSQGIVVAGSDFDRYEHWLIIEQHQEDDRDVELRLVTLETFTESDLKLRRVLYDQGDELLHHCKLTGTSYVESRMPVDVIVNNARVLYEFSRSPEANSESLKILLGEQYENFSYICSTTNSSNWTMRSELACLNNQPIANCTPIMPTPNSSLVQERMQDKTEGEQFGYRSRY